MAKQIDRRAFLAATGTAGVAALVEIEGSSDEPSGEGIATLVYPKTDGVTYPVTLPPGSEIVAITVRENVFSITYRRPSLDGSI